MRLKVANSMPDLSPLMRNLLVTDPGAFAQIYSTQMLERQRQQQADAYNLALGIPPVGAGAPSLTPTGGEYPRAMPGQVPVETQTIPPSIPGMPPGEIQVDTVSPPMTLPGGIQAPSQVTPGAGPMPGQAPPAAVPPGQIPLNPAAIARAGDYPRAIDVQREINRQEFERQQSWEAEQRRIAGEQRSQAFQQQQALEAEQRRIAGEQRAQEFQVGRSQIEQESSLRKELHQHPVYQLNLKASHIAEAAPALMRRALEEGSATAGETMVTELSKIIDPGAASMLSEKQALQTNTILDDMQKWYQYFKGGNKVTIEKLQEIYNVIEDHRIASARSAQAVEKDYQYIAQKRNLDFRVIVPKPITDDMLKPRSIPIASKPGRRQLSRTPEGFSVEEED